MSKYVLTFFIIIYLNSCVNGQSEFVKNLIKKMTNEDKCGQMTHLAIDVVLKKTDALNENENPIDLDKLQYALREKRIGSLQNTP